MGYFIYKYENDKNEIGYIGLTTNLHNRIASHNSDKVGLSEYKNIFYFICENKQQMQCYEYCLIKKYNPPLNIIFNKPNISIILDEPEWIPYTTEGKITYKKDNTDDISSIKKPQVSLNHLFNKEIINDEINYIKPNIQLFTSSGKVNDFRLLGAFELIERLTGESFMLKSKHDILEIANIPRCSDFYNKIEYFKEKNFINSENKININIFKSLTDNELYTFIQQQNLPKYNWLFLELLNQTNFKSFYILKNDLMKIINITNSKELRRLVFKGIVLDQILPIEININNVYKKDNYREIEGFFVEIKHKEKEE